MKNEENEILNILDNLTLQLLGVQFYSICVYNMRSFVSIGLKIPQTLTHKSVMAPA